MSARGKKLAAIRAAAAKELEYRDMKKLLCREYSQAYNPHQPGDRIQYTTWTGDSITNGVVINSYYDPDRGFGYTVQIHTKQWIPAKRRSHDMIWSRDGKRVGTFGVMKKAES